jgi:hypothetical protein
MRILALALLALLQSAPAPPPRLVFEAMEPEHRAAAKEYEAIWAADGARISDALSRRSGLRFEESAIRALVIDGPGSSGAGTTPMRLLASDPAAAKKGTLVHELGHRLQARLFTRNEDDHPYLFLYLYDVWSDLYGEAFADEQVKIESARKGRYDYGRAWTQVLALTEDERIAAWRNFLASRTVRSGEP